MRRRFLTALLFAALFVPPAAQAQSGAADGAPVTIAGVSAVAVNRPGTVTTAVKLRERPSTSAPIVEYWTTTTQKEPELFMPAGTTVIVVARTAEEMKVGDWNSYWYSVGFTTEKQGRVQAWAYGEFIQVDTDWRVPDLVLVEGGTFRMGDSESGIRTVTVSSFLVGRTEVRQADWRSVMRSNPSSFKGDSLPVETVSWYDAVAFCNKLSELDRLDPCYDIKGNDVTCDFRKNGYRLPTEAEWEYAARGGNHSRGYTYAGGDVDAVGWYQGNSGGSTHAVGTKAANELGIYDMSGNVFEWCWDWLGDYVTSDARDPTGPASGSERVRRGGSWYNYGYDLRCSWHAGDGPGRRLFTAGFRIARRGG